MGLPPPVWRRLDSADASPATVMVHLEIDKKKGRKDREATMLDLYVSRDSHICVEKIGFRGRFTSDRC